jgi:hypothetical protein
MSTTRPKLEKIMQLCTPAEIKLIMRLRQLRKSAGHHVIVVQVNPLTMAVSNQVEHLEGIKSSGSSAAAV